MRDSPVLIRIVCVPSQLPDVDTQPSRTFYGRTSTIFLFLSFTRVIILKTRWTQTIQERFLPLTSHQSLCTLALLLGVITLKKKTKPPQSHTVPHGCLELTK